MMDETRRYSFRYEIGDYVKSDDDPSGLYIVYGRYHDYYNTLNETFYENFYDCYCVITRKVYVLDEIGLTLFKRANNVDYDEVRTIVGDYADSNLYTFIDTFADDYERLAEQVTSNNEDRDEEMGESIDELLDELNDVQTLINMFGEHEDDEKKDGKYAKRNREIERKLKEMMLNG